MNGDFMKKKREIIKDGNTEVIFEFKKDNSLPVWLRDNNDKPFFILTVTVRIHNVEVAVYQREFTKEISAIHFQGFIKKFLEDPVYRQQFLVYGNWDGEILLSPLMDVHPECKKQIEYINNSKTLRFKDFKNLKTFGIDRYSKAKLEELEAIIPQEQQDVVKKVFEDKQHILAALRWIARGLKPEHAIRKVKCDMEIKKNKFKAEARAKLKKY